MGRSLFTGIIFNGHSVLDIPTEGIKNTISYKFCFQTTNDNEAVRMCEYLDMEPTEENKDTIKNLGNGQCLFQDLDKHIGILDFDAVFQDFIDVFSTTPTTDEQDELAKLTQETSSFDTYTADSSDVLSGVAFLQRFSQQTDAKESDNNELEHEPDSGTKIINFTEEELLTKV